MKKKTESKDSKEILTCPVCGKEFEPNDDTKYIASGGYTCSWKCFLVVAKKQSEKKNKIKNK